MVYGVSLRNRVTIADWGYSPPIGRDFFFFFFFFFFPLSHVGSLAVMVYYHRFNLPLRN